MTRRELFDRIGRMSKYPPLIALMVICGGLLGFYHRDAGLALAPYGVIFVNLLGMCVLPLMVFAVVAGLGKLLRSPYAQGAFGRMIRLYALGLFIPALAGAAAALIGQPGSRIDPIDLDSLGEALLSSGEPGHESLGMAVFIGRIIPHNVFHALSQGDILSIVFVCILTGLSLGRVDHARADDVLDLADALMAAFERIFKRVMLFLPVGVFCIMAGALANTGPRLLAALTRFMGVYCLGATALFIGYLLFLSRLTGRSPLKLLTALKDPLILAAAANSSLVAMAPAIDAARDELGVDPKIAELVIPFGLVANRQGVIFLFAYATVFLMQIYDAVPGTGGLATTLIGSVLTGMAAEGQGAAMVPILESLLKELAMPTALAGIALTATYCVTGPLANMLIVLGNVILAAYTEKGRNRGGSRKKTVLAAALACLLLPLAAAPSALAQDGAARSPDLDGILARKTLRVAVLSKDIPPMIMTGPGGSLSGLEADLARDVASVLGVEPVFMRLGDSYDAVIGAVGRGEADIGLSDLSVTPERALRVYFSRPYLRQHYALLISRVRLAREPDQAFNPKTTAGPIAVVRGQAAGEIAPKLFPKAKIEAFDSEEERYQAALDGKVLAALSTLFDVKRFLGEKSARALRLRSYIFDKPVDQVAVAVRPDAPRLRYWLDVYIESRDLELTDADMLRLLEEMSGDGSPDGKHEQDASRTGQDGETP